MNPMIRTSLSIVLLGAFWSTTVLAESIIAIDAEQRAAFGIETSVVTAADATLSKAYPAKVAVPNSHLRVVSAPLDGVLEALLVAEGEAVKAGQPLAQMRSQGLLDLQAAFLESKTRRELAQETVERDRALYADGIIAKRRWLESDSAFREARTAEARDRQALSLAGMSEAAIARLAGSGKLSAVLDVVAPLDGVVLEQIATAGQRLAGADPLYRIGDLSSLWIEVHVALDALGDIVPGSHVTLAGDLDAKVITVGRMVHGADQGVLVRAEVREGAATLRPGQFVEARLRYTADRGLRLPAGALVRVGGLDQVFVARDGGFAVVPVTVRNREAESVVVTGALASGDAVVVRGTAALKAALAAGAE